MRHARQLLGPYLSMFGYLGTSLKTDVKHSETRQTKTRLM